MQMKSLVERGVGAEGWWGIKERTKLRRGLVVEGWDAGAQKVREDRVRKAAAVSVGLE